MFTLRALESDGWLRGGAALSGISPYSFRLALLRDITVGDLTVWDGQPLFHGAYGVRERAAYAAEDAHARMPVAFGSSADNFLSASGARPAPDLLALPGAIDLSSLDGVTGFAATGANTLDWTGGSVAGGGDVNGDGISDVVIGAFFADPGGVETAGLAYVLFGSSQPFDPNLPLGSLAQAQGFTITGVTQDDAVGSSVALCDVNGDGLSDILLGAFNNNRSYVVFGSASGFSGDIDLGNLSSEQGFAIESNASFIANAGDVNNDGIDDIILGHSSLAGTAGQTFVIFGSTTTFPDHLFLGTLDGSNGFRLDGIDSNDRSGQVVGCAGDVNGDGIDDLFVHAPLADPNGVSNAGETYVVFGSAEGFAPILSLASLNGVDGFTINGFRLEEWSAESIVAGGDINGDGYSDIIIGNAHADPGGRVDAGQCYVVFGGEGFDPTLDLSTLDGINGFTIEGADPGDGIGYSVAGAGDINGDGVHDLIIGGTGPQSYILFGSFGGFSPTVELGALNGSNGLILTGSSGQFAVSAAGDVNSDGVDDVILGSRFSGPAAEGQAFVVFGSSPFDVSWAVSFDEASSPYSDYFADITRVLLAAGHQWSSHLGGSGAIQVTVSIVDIPLSGDPPRAPHAGTDAIHYIEIGNSGGHPLWEHGVGYEIRTGVDSNGAITDVIFVINAIYLTGATGHDAGSGMFWFDPDPFSGTPTVPEGMRDAMSTFMHEIGHSLGILGADGFGNTPPGSVTPYDTLVVSIDGTDYFTGPNAQAVYGGPVPLNTPVNPVYHLNVEYPGGLRDLMWYTRADGQAGRTPISALDLAILNDCGVPIANGTEDDDVLNCVAGQDTINGAGGDDFLTGNAGDNVLTGAVGGDSLAGGAGVDMSVYSIASTSATWARDLDGSWTVTAGADGVDTVTNIEFLDFIDRDVFLDRAARTFSGDGASDILWRNASGQTVIWDMNGETVASGGGTSVQVGLVWSVIDTGDFNGDGRDDILWRHTSGQTVIWQMNGGAVSQAGSTSVQVGAAWTIQGVGDFNLDGRDDIVWRNTNGLTVIWHMDGTTLAGGGATNAQVGNAWQIAGIGDFNGDGRDDFVWRHTNGLTAIWHMNGTQVASSGLTSLSAGLNWNIAGVGDFNGDGRDDILWRNTNGQTVIWHMDGTNAQGAALSIQVGNAWAIAAVGDYNGDGSDDILWRNTSGVIVLWEMDGANVIDASVTSVQVGNEWGIV